MRQALKAEVSSKLSLGLDCIPVGITDFSRGTSKKTRAFLGRRKATAERAKLANNPMYEPTYEPSPGMSA